jgi:hypothetical protein
MLQSWREDDLVKETATDTRGSANLQSSEIPLSNICLGRRFAHSLKGLMGVVPAAAAVGDTITVVPHSSAPIVLRHVSDSHYRLMGEFYIHGIMDGRAIGRDVDWEAVVLQ